MNNSKLRALLRFTGLVSLMIALVSVVALQFWQFAEEILKSSEEQSLAVNYFVSGSERDTTMLLLARQLGLTRQQPLSQEDARREFWISYQKLRILNAAEARHANGIYEQLVGPVFKTKMALFYIVVLAVGLETWVRIKSAWRDFRTAPATKQPRP